MVTLTGVGSSPQRPYSTQSKISPQSKRIRNEKVGVIELVKQIAVVHFNDQEGRAFEDKWYISFAVLQTLLRANGLSANQKNVAVVFEQMREQLEQHHDQHQLGSRHNRRHPLIEKIIERVSLN